MLQRHSGRGRLLNGLCAFCLMGVLLVAACSSPTGSDPPMPPTVELAADINPAAGAGSSPSFLFLFGDKLYFRANDGSTGNELWKYDGGSPSQVANLNAGSADGLHPTSPFDFFAVFSSRLFFRAQDGANGYELWQYDGTNVPTMVEDPATGSAFPIYPAVFGSSLYFGATDANGYELWEYDGTNDPTMVDDINGTGSSTPSFLTVFGGVLYFQAVGDGAVNTELWKYDGVADPSVVYEINPTGGSAPQFLTVFNSKLYFRADNGPDGFELWAYDGVANPSQVANINLTTDSNPAYMTVFKNKLYFSADDGIKGAELWVYDGSSDPTMVADINPLTVPAPGSSSPAYLTVFDDKLFFAADDGSSGVELWMYDGVYDPSRVADINPSGSSSPSYLTVLGDTLYFAADDGTNGRELWKAYY